MEFGRVAKRLFDWQFAVQYIDAIAIQTAS